MVVQTCCRRSRAVSTLLTNFWENLRAAEPSVRGREVEDQSEETCRQHCSSSSSLRIESKYMSHVIPDTLCVCV